MEVCRKQSLMFNSLRDNKGKKKYIQTSVQNKVRETKVDVQLIKR